MTLDQVYEAAANVRMQNISITDIVNAKNTRRLVEKIGPLTIEHVEAGARKISQPLAEVEKRPSPNS